MTHVMLDANDYLHDQEINMIKHTAIGEMPFHSHEFIEFSYIESGQGVHLIGENKYPIIPGDIYILNSNIAHQLISDEEKPLVVYNCVFQPQSIHDDIIDNNNFVNIAYQYLFHTLTGNEISSEYIRISCKNYPQIGMIFEEMNSECEKKQNGYKQVVKSDLLKLLIFMFRVYKEDNSQTHNKLLYKKLVVNNVISYLNEHYGEAVKCDDLAERVYLNLSSLSYIFKEITGKTIIAYLQEVRINAACRLLEKSEYTVSDIAERTGYSDIKYFYSVFKKIKNETPGEYRARFTRK